MKLTLEPTKEMCTFGQHKVVLELPHDDCTLDEVIQLVTYAIGAYGFSRKSIAEYFEAVVVGDEPVNKDDFQVAVPEGYATQEL